MRRSLLFLSLCIGCILGIGIADILGIFAVLIIIGIIIMTTFFLPRYHIVVFLLCLGLLIGGFRFELNDWPKNYAVISEEVTIQGVIKAEVEKNINKQRVVLQVDDFLENETINILVTLPLYPEFHFGEVLSLAGELKVPEDFSYEDEYKRQVTFAYSEYLRLKNIDYVMYYPYDVKSSGMSGQMFVRQKLFQTKKLVTKQLQKILPEPHAAFISAILWGSRNALDLSLIHI